MRGCTHYGSPEFLREYRLADKVVTSEGDFVGRILVGLCLSIIIRGTHHKCTRTNAHHLEADAIDGKGHRWVGQYLKVQSHYTITTVDILQGVGVGARAGVYVAVPSIGLACADGVEGLVSGVILANHAIGIQYKAEGTATIFAIFGNIRLLVSIRCATTCCSPSRTTTSDIGFICDGVSQRVYLCCGCISTMTIVYVFPYIARHIVEP